MIASHYAEPVPRSLKTAAVLRREGDEGAESIEQLPARTAFLLLDDSRGWAWGYAGSARLVGYVATAALA